MSVYFCVAAHISVSQRQQHMFAGQPVTLLQSVSKDRRICSDCLPSQMGYGISACVLLVSRLGRFDPEHGNPMYRRQHGPSRTGQSGGEVSSCRESNPGQARSLVSILAKTLRLPFCPSLKGRFTFISDVSVPYQCRISSVSVPSVQCPTHTVTCILNTTIHTHTHPAHWTDGTDTELTSLISVNRP
jgi:hypothetical protein